MLRGEHEQARPDGYQYGWFCAACRARAAKTTWSCASRTRPARSSSSTGLSNVTLSNPPRSTASGIHDPRDPAASWLVSEA